MGLPIRRRWKSFLEIKAQFLMVSAKGGNGMNTSRSPNKWALLIGIDKYPNFSQLSGCINDIDLMAQILNHNFGFPEDNIELLKDESATREGILKAIYDLVDKVGKDDIVVIHYSGHGSRRKDFEGDDPDGYDETIVPYNSGRDPYPNLDIIDDEIYAWLLELTKNTDYVSLIFDSCHSGSVTRDIFGAKGRWVEPDLRTAEEMGVKTFDLETARESNRDLGPSGWLPLGKRYVLIAACRDDETASEHNVYQNGNLVCYGALTYFLSQELINAATGDTYRDVFERACLQVTASYKRQHPQVEGARNRELFGVLDVNPLRFVSVKNRIMDQIILGAGAAQGITIGSQWAVYPQDTKQVDAKTPKLGLIEVTAIKAVTANAKIVEESEVGAIKPNARALEDAHFYGEMRILIDIQVPEGYERYVAELDRLIGKSNLLRLIRDGENADVRIYIIEPRLEVTKDSIIPQLGSVDKAIWAIVGQDGKLMMPTHPLEKDHAAFKIKDNLEKAARYKNTLALKNPNSQNSLKGKIDFILMRQSSDGVSWIEAKPDDTNGQIIFEENDRVAFRIVNNHDNPVYVSVLDFGLKGAISLLYPNEGASVKLASGRDINVGIQDGDEITLSFPAGFAEMDDPYDKIPLGGVETFKLFVTTYEADFSLLAQNGFRGIESSSLKGTATPLSRLLEMSLTGYGTRDAIRNRVGPDEEWIALERSFFLKAKNTSDSQKDRYPEHTTIPDFARKDFVIDAPWRVQSENTPIPILVYIKDAHKKPFTLQNIRIYKKGQNNPVLEYKPDSGLRIGSPEWLYFFSGKDLVIGKHDGPLTAKDFSTNPANTIDIVVIIGI
ncbi:hypothetical protein FJZ33_02635, partial [Candidatus Poribacteria bacterium]|nr:hypothetical protein [Candidatus Poribacteria bacterium]